MTAGQQETSRFLLVQAGEVDYLLPLDRVRRVLAGLRLFPFPGAAPVVAGLAEVGGEPLVVLDLGRLAGSHEGAAAGGAVTVVAAVGPSETPEMAGLAVDEALDILDIPAADITRLRDGVVSGEAMAAGRTARVLDLAAVGSGP